VNIQTAFIFGICLFLSACLREIEKTVVGADSKMISKGLSLVVLGTVQDAGSPHIACKRDCCAVLFENPNPTRKVVSLGVLDHENQQTFLFDATPDIAEQVKLLKNYASWEDFSDPCAYWSLFRLDVFGKRSNQCQSYSYLCNAKNENVFGRKRTMESVGLSKKY